MAQRAISEYDAKRLLAEHLPQFDIPKQRVLISAQTDLPAVVAENEWLREKKLTVKLDQLVTKRAERGLLHVDVGLEDALQFVQANMLREITIDNVKGKLTNFLIEPYHPKTEGREYYAAITQEREGDRILFSEQGGTGIEERWEEVDPVLLPVIEPNLQQNLQGLPSLPAELIPFLGSLFDFYTRLHFTYLELNPFILEGPQRIIPIDVKAKLDDSAAWECSELWNLAWPQPFGSETRESERYIEELDSKTGASLKLKVLNPQGKIWLLVAGGGASMIYADTVCDLGYSHELANYGEYSGNPAEEFMYKYTKTLLSEMNPGRKALLIGGGIANFTDIDKTFHGIIRALREDKEKLRDCLIYVRRGGRRYKEGLEMMRQLGEQTGLSVEVYGPEEHMTSIVAQAIQDLNLGDPKSRPEKKK